MKINRSKCIGCFACKASCPVDAIKIDEATSKPIIDKTKCVNCGTCKSICPVGAPIEGEEDVNNIKK